MTMKPRHIHLILLITSLLTVTAHAGMPQLLTSKEQDWNFIQSVGGMTVSLKDTSLAIDCDVSGLKTVTVKPTMINSGMGVRKLKHKRKGNTIDLTLVTCVIGKGVSTSPKPVDLSTCPNGQYAVRYRDPGGTTHAIRTIVINRQKERPKNDRFETGKSLKDKEERAPLQVEDPTIQLTIRTAQGVDNINIKRGRKSFLNYAVGTPDQRVEAATVSDEVYVELRDLSLAVLRNPPPTTDGKYVININVPLSEQDGANLGVVTNTCTFSYQPGQLESVDRLLTLTAALLKEEALAVDTRARSHYAD